MRKKISLPFWGLMAIVLIAGGLGAAAGVTVSAEDTEVAATTPSSSTTDTTDTTTTTATPPSSPPAPTTTVAVTPELRNAAFNADFPERARNFGSSLEEEPGAPTVSTVDKFTYDSKARVVILAVTSEFSSDEVTTDAAWDITRIVMDIWESEAFDASFSPALHLTVNRISRRCPGDFMLQMVQRAASRQDWDRACR